MPMVNCGLPSTPRTSDTVRRIHPVTADLPSYRVSSSYDSRLPSTNSRNSRAPTSSADVRHLVKFMPRNSSRV